MEPFRQEGSSMASRSNFIFKRIKEFLNKNELYELFQRCIGCFVNESKLSQAA